MDAPRSVAADFQGGAVIWARAFGGPGNDIGYSAAIDDLDRIVLSGSFSLSADLGGPSRATSAGSEDAFLARYAFSDGAHEWSLRLGGSSNEAAYSVAVDATGSALVGGYFQGTVDFGGGPVASAGIFDAYAMKSSSVDGARLWSLTFGATSNDWIDGIAVDSVGDVIVVGPFAGTVDFGGGPRTGGSGENVHVVKYAGAAGAFLWARIFGGALDDFGYDVAVDPAGDVVTVGLFQGSTDFGDGLLIASVGGPDAFVVKYAGTDGAHMWARTFGSSGRDVALGAAVDATGDVVLAGQFEGTVSFGPFRLISRGLWDAFVMKLSGVDGTVLWAVQIGGTENDIGNGVAVDPEGNVVVVGTFGATALVGTALGLGSAGLEDAFVAKLRGSDGQPLWARALGGPGVDVGYAVAAASTSGVAATGYFERTARFGGASLSGAGSSDIFLVRLGR